MRIPFFLRRPLLVLRGAAADRDQPDLDRLRAIDDPEDFIWAILPHAARSFATSILVLPRREAWAAAVAYLQCRILDTYEDLLPDVTARPAALREVGMRWTSGTTAAPPPIPKSVAHSKRDLVHLLLIEQIDHIDAAYRGLDESERSSIDELVANMAEGMAWAAETFQRQGGVLVDASQRATYCHHVIGEPALYAMRSLLHLPITAERRQDALDVAVLIQSANITRDIEKDLERGVGYDAALEPILWRKELDDAGAALVAEVRREIMVEALRHLPAYRRLVADLPGGISQARGAAMIMLGFTDRYYAGCAKRSGIRPWPRRRRFQIYIDGILGTISPAYASRVMDRVAGNFAAATDDASGK